MDDGMRSYTVRLRKGEYENIKNQTPKWSHDKDFMFLTLALLNGTGYAIPKYSDTRKIRNWFRARREDAYFRGNNRRKLSPTRQRILTYIEGVETVIPSDIADALGLNYQQAYRQLQRLIFDGQVVKKKGRYYKA